jgi:hypothetical protein
VLAVPDGWVQPAAIKRRTTARRAIAGIIRDLMGKCYLVNIKKVPH